MNNECGCERGDDCTRTTVCALNDAVEDATTALKHDIERSVDRNTELLARNELLEKVLASGSEFIDQYSVVTASDDFKGIWGRMYPLPARSLI